MDEIFLNLSGRVAPLDFPHKPSQLLTTLSHFSGEKISPVSWSFIPMAMLQLWHTFSKNDLSVSKILFEKPDEWNIKTLACPLSHGCCFPSEDWPYVAPLKSKVIIEVNCFYSFFAFRQQCLRAILDDIWWSLIRTLNLFSVSIFFKCNDDRPAKFSSSGMGYKIIYLAMIIASSNCDYYDRPVKFSPSEMGSLECQW